MKKIEAVIKPDRLPVVLDKISKFEHGSISYYDTWYRRISGDFAENLNQERNAHGFLYKTKVELTVEDDQVDSAISALCEGGYSGGGCDGRIFVMPVEQTLRIKSPESSDFHL